MVVFLQSDLQTIHNETKIYLIFLIIPPKTGGQWTPEIFFKLFYLFL